MINKTGGTTQQKSHIVLLTDCNIPNLCFFQSLINIVKLIIPTDNMSGDSIFTSIRNVLYRKEVLLWTPLLMDVSLALFTYPTFRSQGMRAVVAFGHPNSSKEDIDNTVNRLETDNDVVSIWETMMIAYSGYSLLLFGSTYLCYHSEKARNVTGFAMLALMFAKKFLLNKHISTREKADDNDVQNMKGKDDVLNWFYFPFYGGYCAIILANWYKSYTSAK